MLSYTRIMKMLERVHAEGSSLRIFGVSDQQMPQTIKVGALYVLANGSRDVRYKEGCFLHVTCYDLSPDLIEGISGQILGRIRGLMEHSQTNPVLYDRNGKVISLDGSRRMGLCKGLEFELMPVCEEPVNFTLLTQKIRTGPLDVDKIIKECTQR